MLENMCEKVCEPKTMLELRCGGMSEAWKYIDKAHQILQELMATPNCAAYGFAEMELGRESRKSM